MPLDAAATALLLDRACAAVIAAKDLLTDADRAIGDGDHGVVMAGACEAARGKLAGSPPASPGDAFKTVGMAILSTAGGACGAVFGTLFLSAAAPLQARDGLDGEGLAAAWAASLEAIQKRGGAKPGDKTMLDALAPAVAALQAAGSAPLPAALAAAAEAARAGMEHTKTLVAVTGKAKTLRERSLGHPDPGAISFTILVEAMRDAAAEAEPA